MARARFIRPEFFTDSKTGRLGISTRLLYIAMWPQADIQGVLEWDADQLRLAAFPYDPYTTERVASMMAELVDRERVAIFEVGGKVYGLIRKWGAHQTFTTGEKKNGPRFPAPPPALLSDHGQTTVRPMSDIGQTPSPSPSPPPSPAPSPSSPLPINPTTTAATLTRVEVIDKAEAAQALADGDLCRLLQAMRCTVDKATNPEWPRADVTGGLVLHTVAAVLYWRICQRDPVRMPSGFQKARKLFNEQPDAERREIVKDTCEYLGIACPAMKAPTAPERIAP